MTIVEALEIDLVEIDPRPDVVQHARRAVAVRDVRGQQTCGSRFLEDGHRPFARDQGLVVRRDDDARAETACVADDVGGLRIDRRRDGRRIAKRLRRHPVLTVRAVEIAAEHAEAVRERARMGVEERLLLDRIALDAADVAPRHLQGSTFVESNFADAGRALRYRALMATRVAAQTVPCELFDQLGRRLVCTSRQQILQSGHSVI